MVLGRENWSHQLEISRNACIKLRLERDACPRNTARYCSRAIPEPPSRKLMTVSSCSMPSISESIAAPTRDGSSPSSFANVLQKLSSLSCAKCKAVHLHAIHSEYLQYGHPQPSQTRTPLLNSSRIFGFRSRHSGQISRTFRSGPNICAFC